MVVATATACAGVACAAWESYKAVRDARDEAVARLLRLWLLISLFFLAEPLGDALLGFVPLYGAAKLALMGWLFLAPKEADSPILRSLLPQLLLWERVANAKWTRFRVRALDLLSSAVRRAFVLVLPYAVQLLSDGELERVEGCLTDSARVAKAETAARLRRSVSLLPLAAAPAPARVLMPVPARELETTSAPPPATKPAGEPAPSLAVRPSPSSKRRHARTITASSAAPNSFIVHATLTTRALAEAQRLNGIAEDAENVQSELNALAAFAAPPAEPEHESQPEPLKNLLARASRHAWGMSDSTESEGGESSVETPPSALSSFSRSTRRRRNARKSIL
jgi:hypothetical protein